MAVLLLTKPMPTEPLARRIREIDPDIRCIERREDADPAEVDAVLGWRMRDGLAAALPNLRLVCANAAGVEKLVTPDLPAHVPVARIVDPRVNLGIAQHVAGMALRFARDFRRYERQAAERVWIRFPVDVAAHRVGILGMGEVGTTIARTLSVLGFQVRGWSTRRRPDLPFPTRGAGELDEFLADSEILVCALPLTPATVGLIDARVLAALPRGAYLINVARGSHVVEPDLIAAVRSGHLGGAALDVQCSEPMAADDPLWDVEGITITPHIAGQASLDVVAAQFVESYRAMRSGQPIPRIVDRAKGY
jgi:D-3-phosphoglycerate dehydrogenase/glyoxylate/hydroxypyruvate reductase A